jgi:predicted unusual protein kinase regulating ubiquinone biosynthesis (AarF/ABC1/UbiB family)
MFRMVQRFFMYPTRHHFILNMNLFPFSLQLLDTGFFHADPHPGNLIRTPDGKLAILDFGNNLPQLEYMMNDHPSTWLAAS